MGRTTAVHGHVIRAYQPPGKQPFIPGRDVASYLSGQTCLAVRIAATRGWFTRTDARKSAGGLLEQASRRADARQHYYVGLADSVWSETPDALNADIFRL